MSTNLLGMSSVQYSRLSLKNLFFVRFFCCSAGFLKQNIFCFLFCMKISFNVNFEVYVHRMSLLTVIFCCYKFFAFLFLFIFYYTQFLFYFIIFSVYLN